MTSVKNDTHEIYQELNSYMKLSQEDIDGLYEEAGITEKSYSRQLQELEKKLKEEKTLSVEEKLLRSIFGDSTTTEDQQKEIQKLEEKMKELRNKTSCFEENLLTATTKKSYPSRKYPSKDLRNQIFLGTVGIARYYARVYYYKVKNQYRFSYDDLFQIACEALLSACHYYVPTGRATFKTYASRCIDNQLKKEIRLSKRKSKKTITVEEELDRMHILKSFLEKVTFKGYGKIFEMEDLEENPTVALYRLNRAILQHNQEVLNLGEPERVWKRVNRKVDRERATEKLEEVFQMFQGYLKESQMKSIISDEDRELVSLLAGRKNYKKKDAITFTLFEYLELYIMRLYQLDNYLKMERKLLEENDGILPEDPAILSELNRSVKEANAFLKSHVYPNFLEERTNFIREYMEEFDVNLIDKEEREEYLEKIADMYENSWQGIILDTNFDMDLFYENGEVYIDDFIGSLDVDDLLNFVEKLEISMKNLQEKYTQYREENDCRVIFVKNLIFCCEGNGNTIPCIGAYMIQEGSHGYTLEDAIDIFSEEIKNIRNFISNCNVQQEEFNRRKEMIQKRVQGINEDIFKRNQARWNRVLLYHVLSDCNRKRLKKWNLETLNEVREYVHFIYCDDETLMGWMERKATSQRTTEKSLEEEVLEHQFFEDYTDALRTLPLVQQKIWELWYDEDGMHSMTAKEIAKELGISESKVYKEKEKAKVLLRKNEILSSYYEDC